MKLARRSTLIQGAFLTLALLAVGYFVWQRYHPPSAPTYEGKTLDQWIEDLSDPDFRVSDRAADVLTAAGEKAVPVLLEARGRNDIRLYRRVLAVLVRIGAPAAPRMVEILQTQAKEPGIEVVLVRLGPAAVPALREALADEKNGDAAAHMLGLIGFPAVDAVPDLIALLQRRETPPRLRSQAAFALGHIGEPADSIVPALSAALQDSKKEVRQQAAEALGWIGPPARKAVPALIAALKDDDAKVARKACQTLAFVGDAEAVMPLSAAFRSDRTEVAAEAAWALWQLGPKADPMVPALLSAAQGPIAQSAPARTLLASFGPRIVSVLIKALSDNDAARREAAAEVLGRIGPPARSAVPALIAALKDRAPNVGLTAAMALAQIDATRAGPAVPLLADSLHVPGAAMALANIGPDARAAVPALLAALKPRKDKEAANQQELRGAARLALARIGKPAVPALLEALKDQREGVAPLAGEALGWVLPPQKEAVPALREAIQNDRIHAGIYAHALGQLGPLARPASPDLTNLLADPASRIEAAIALTQLDPEQARKTGALLVKAAQSDQEKERQSALAALVRLGPAVQPAAGTVAALLRDRRLTKAEIEALNHLWAKEIPSLVDLLNDPQLDCRKRAMLALAQIGPSASTAVKPLIATLSNRDADERTYAAGALQAIGPEASEAVPALIANLQSSYPQVRFHAALALGHIGAGAKEALRPLLECLLDPEEHVRYGAVLALGRIDPRFTAAVPVLRNALDDPSAEVQLAAIDSLSRIDHTAAVKDGVSILRDFVRKPENLDVRFRATDGLSTLAPDEDQKKAATWLHIELTDPNPASVNYAARLLAVIDFNQSSTLVLALAAALRTLSPEARLAILQSLGEFGPKAREVVPDIERLLYDGTPGIRPEAIRALRAIYPARLKELGVD